MAKKSKKWNERLFELLIIFGMSCAAYFILKNSELGSVNFFVYLAFGFAYLYHNVENLKFDWLSFCLFWVESYRRILLKSLSKMEMSMANNREPINEVANQKTFFRRNESRHKIGWSTSFDRWFIKTRMVFNKQVKIDVLAVKQTCPR